MSERQTYAFEMSTEAETSTNPLRWIAGWVKSESFWRDVASRAVAGTIVIALGAGTAVAFGIINWREFGRGSAYVSVVCLAILVTLRLTVGFIGPVFKATRKIKNRWVQILAEGLATALIGVPLFLGISICQVLFPFVAAL